VKAAIKVTNTYSWLVTDTLRIKELLHKGLRFRAKNYFHSRLWKQHLWDGYDEFFKKDTGRFLTGLLPEVEFALKELKCEYVLKDERTPPAIICTEIKPDFLEKRNPNPKKPFILTDYQCDLPSQAVIQKRCTIQAPTSAGKTAIMMSVLDCIDPKTLTLILAGRVQPVVQAYDGLKEWGFDRVGRVYGKFNNPDIITCANVDSIHKLEPLLPHIKCLIVDEVHDKIITATGKKILAKLTGCGMRIAVSATPFKFDGNDKTHKFFVKGYFGPLLKTQSASAVDGVIQTKKLQESGRLSKSKCTFYVIRTPELPFELYQDAVTKGIAQNWEFHRTIARLVAKKKAEHLLLWKELSMEMP
jgi:superfamily II DNA or RNA helicase